MNKNVRPADVWSAFSLSLSFDEFFELLRSLTESETFCVQSHGEVWDNSSGLLIPSLEVLLKTGNSFFFLKVCSLSLWTCESCPLWLSLCSKLHGWHVFNPFCQAAKLLKSDLNFTWPNFTGFKDFKYLSWRKWTEVILFLILWTKVNLCPENSQAR